MIGSMPVFARISDRKEAVRIENAHIQKLDSGNTPRFKNAALQTGCDLKSYAVYNLPN